MCVTEHQWRKGKKEEGKKEEFWERLGLFILERWVSPITPDYPRSARYDQKLKSTTKGIIELFSFFICFTFWEMFMSGTNTQLQQVSTGDRVSRGCLGTSGPSPLFMVLVLDF